MKQKFIVKYISILFILATFTGFLHQHNDLVQHDDCKICIIQHTLNTVDIPIDIVYITSLESYFQRYDFTPLFNFNRYINTSKARAPPLFS